MMRCDGGTDNVWAWTRSMMSASTSLELTSKVLATG